MKKSVFVTGASSGIGLAATRELASGGYEVFATYRSEAGLHELEGIENAHPLKMDVTDAADLARAFATVAERVGENGLYALVNNAGIGYAAPFEFAEEVRGREVMEVNVMAPTGSPRSSSHCSSPTATATG
ncbi:MAG TPA: SDR family NAD(P)-dependent oxidoreductase [Solirubrobacterales bacterium]|nr:SDR family NAD(P)-dependent oxidoreductase [Solirubrobacterales bacterium]